MKYKKLFKNLRQYTVDKPDINLEQYKEICRIIWNNMSPTEKDLFQELYQASQINLSRQLSIEQAIRVVHDRYKVQYRKKI